jgi:predicted dehydrogenase
VAPDRIAPNCVAPVRLAVIGAGRIGRLHCGVAAAEPAEDLVALSALDPDAEDLARRLGVPLLRDYRSVLETAQPQAVVIATPNRHHLEVGAFFAEAGVHVLVEKPIADTVAAGAELVAAAERGRVHLLVGHHRRHNALVRAARDIVRSGRLGRVVGVNVMATMLKPGSYYAASWRRQADAGPLLVNLVHEVDLLRDVIGEIDHVLAAGANLVRGFDFDDTAAIVVRFASGALGTILLTESTPSPWSWEASVREGLGFHEAGQDHAYILGTDAALSFPRLERWTYDGDEPDPGWRAPLRSEIHTVATNDPYAAQIRNLADVVRGTASPVVAGPDGLGSLAVVEAIIEAARRGRPVDVAAVRRREPA